MAELPNIKSWLLDVKFELTKQGWKIEKIPMNAKKEVWFITDTCGTIVEATTTAPSPERECSLLEKGFAVYRRYVDLPETRPTTLRNLQAEENANLRKQVAEGKERMAELRAECDRLTSAPVSQLRADLDFLRAENAALAKTLQGARESVNGQTRALTQVTVEAQTLRAELHEMGQSCHAEAKLRQRLANELSSVKDQLCRTGHSLDRCRLMLNDVRSTLRALNINNSWDGLYDLLKRLEQ